MYTQNAQGSYDFLSLKHLTTLSNMHALTFICSSTLTLTKAVLEKLSS